MPTPQVRATIRRLAADSTDLGTWVFVREADGFLCAAPDGVTTHLRAATLSKALTAFPDALRLSDLVVHTIEYTDPDLHPADLADLVTEASPHLANIAWQDSDRWDEDLYRRHVDTEDLIGTSDVIDGDIPITINELRCFPVSVLEDGLRLLPFELLDGATLNPYFVADLGGFDASNEWGSYGSTTGVLPRGYKCQHEIYDDMSSISFERLENIPPQQLHEDTIAWASGLLETFPLQQSPTLAVNEDGDVEEVWPDGYDPNDHGESASVYINPNPTT